MGRRLEPRGPGLFVYRRIAGGPEVPDARPIGEPGEPSRRSIEDIGVLDHTIGGLFARDQSRPPDGWVLVEWATHDCERTGWKNPAKLDALAAAYAEAGDYNAAAKRREVAFATHLCAAANWKDPDRLTALAAAYAGAGDFTAAVKWQTLAIAMCPGEKEKADGEARLKCYQARKPYRQTTP